VRPTLVLSFQLQGVCLGESGGRLLDLLPFNVPPLSLPRFLSEGVGDLIEGLSFLPFPVHSHFSGKEDVPLDNCFVPNGRRGDPLYQKAGITDERHGSPLDDFPEFLFASLKVSGTVDLLGPCFKWLLLPLS